MNSTITNKIKHFPQLFSLGPQIALLLSFQINHYQQNRYTFISIKMIVFARINCKLSACHNKNLIVFYAQNKPLPATNVHAIAQSVSLLVSVPIAENFPDAKMIADFRLSHYIELKNTSAKPCFLGLQNDFLTVSLTPKRSCFLRVGGCWVKFF